MQEERHMWSEAACEKHQSHLNSRNHDKVSLSRFSCSDNVRLLSIKVHGV